MRYALTFLLAIAASSPLCAQSTNWREFYPLHPGDEWWYVTITGSYCSMVGGCRYGENRGKTEVTRTVTSGDTTWYFRAHSSWTSGPDGIVLTMLGEFDKLRYDDSSKRVYSRGLIYPYREYTVFELARHSNATPADQLPAGFSGNAFRAVEGEAVLDALEGVGVVRNARPSSTPATLWLGYNLVYAKVQGVDYGQKIVVGTTSEAAERPEAAPLRLWPNPSRGAVTVEAAPRASVVAFDLLGREAVRTVAGADGRAALTLAPGVYVVAAGSQRQTLVVR